MNLFEYFFAPAIDKEGKREAFSRFDIASGAIFIFSSIVTVAYWAQRHKPIESEDWRRIGIAGGISVFILVISRFRMMLVAAALFFAGVRLTTVPFFLLSASGHRLSLFLWGVGCLLVACVILKIRMNRSRSTAL